MNIGYIRVSTQEQNIERQISELKKYGIEDRYIFIDRLSGATKSDTRPGFSALKMVIRAGDVLYIHELDRLGRNKTDITKELRYFKENNILVRILDIPTTMVNLDADNETTKIIMDMVNNVLIEVMATLAEADFNRIHKRQKEGIEAAKKRGVKLGRPTMQITEDFKKAYTSWKNKEKMAKDIISDLKMKPASFYKLAKVYEKSLYE